MSIVVQSKSATKARPESERVSLKSWKNRTLQQKAFQLAQLLGARLVLKPRHCLTGM